MTDFTRGKMFLLHEQLDMIELMNADLRAKITTSFDDLDVPQKANVSGCFDLTDLERQNKNDKARGIRVGVAYLSGERVLGARPGPNSNVDVVQRAVSSVEFRFLVILGMCEDPDCNYRYSATQLLTVMRRGVSGTRCGDDTVNRTWVWVAERPEPSASSSNYLYYSQIWQLSMTNIGNNQSV